MQGSSSNFVKSEKKNRRFDDGVGKQANAKKFKQSKKHSKSSQDFNPGFKH